MTTQSESALADAAPKHQELNPANAGTGLTSARTASWVKYSSIGVSVLAFLVMVRALPINEGLQFAITWIEDLGPAAPLAFIGLYFVATMVMLPAWPLSVAAGMLFGLFGGTAVVVAGATSGAAGAFVLTRYLARDYVERKIRHYPRFAAVDHAVGEGGWKIVALLRLSPALPFTLQNYFYGLTAIRFWPGVLATAVAILPGVFMYVYFGYAGRASLEAAAAGGAAPGGVGQYVLLGVGLAATVAVTVYVTRLAWNAIQQYSDLAPPEEDPADAASSAPAQPWRGAALAASAAAVLVTLAACAQIQPNFIMRWFQPPAVAMAETYERDPQGATFDHSTFDAILKEYVNEAGGVDYAGLAEEPDALLAYNESLADAPFDDMGRNEKLALLINAYNSFTLQLMIEWLDEDGIDGIRDIPRSESWDAPRWNVAGMTPTLNDIEHEEIRPNFVEPNIHWALVCAAVGCPPLRPEAYTGDRVEEQLQDQAEIVHTNDTRWFQYDPEANTLGLTQLYNWYGGDFEQVAGSPTLYAAEYAHELADAVEADAEPSVHWLNYDWALNNQENLP